VAIVQLDRPLFQRSGVSSWKWLSRRDDSGSVLLDVDSELAVAGFRITLKPWSRELRWWRVMVTSIIPGAVVVKGIGDAACFGDSGGPLLNASGDIVGILTRGSGSCRGVDEYLLLGPLREWLIASVPFPRWKRH
jgi:hypothetical protein